MSDNSVFVVDPVGKLVFFQTPYVMLTAFFSFVQKPVCLHAYKWSKQTDLSLI